MPDLRELVISGSFTGSIPNFNLPNLEYLAIYGQNNLWEYMPGELTGPIPDFNMPNLKTLAISGNKLTGSIPNFNMPNLEKLMLNSNQLTGSIPNLNLPNLQMLVLAYNKLTGTIPNFNMPNLSQLELNVNQLTGPIPNFSNSPNLTFLVLSYNQLSGTVPNLNWSNFSYLFMNYNCGLVAFDATQATMLNSKTPTWQQLGNCMQVSPTTLTFNATQGSSNPATQSFNISPIGNVVLTWTTSVSPSSWLKLNTITGTAPSTVTASVNITGLVANSYSSTITVNSNAGKQNVMVNLTVNEAPTPTPTNTPTPTPSPTHTPTFTPTPTDPPSPTPTDTPSPTPSPTPTNTPTPTPSPTPNAHTFRVERDGLSFQNFRYDKSQFEVTTSWELFKKVFPNTSMELTTNGITTKRLGALTYFDSTRWYQAMGRKGNCAGFSAVSLIRYLNLVSQTVELQLLTPLNQAITQTAKLGPAPTGIKNPTDQKLYVLAGSNDVADYVHLYQVRQHSYQFGLWWLEHDDDSPLEVFTAIKQLTQAQRPVAIDIFSTAGGHRMVAYRTEEQGNMGYIYLYDSNWPLDNSRRLQINLTTGAWLYELWAGEVWQGNGTEHGNPRYSLAETNFPAQAYDYTNNVILRRAGEQTHVMLNIEGAQLLLQNSQGQRMGYVNGQWVDELPTATRLRDLSFNPDEPQAVSPESYFLLNSTYTVTIQPLETNSAYTVTAFGNGSAMQLSQLSIATQTVDTLLLNGSVLSTTFKPATDQAYCQTLTAETSTASREFVSCVNGQVGAAVTFGLTDTGLTIKNEGARPVTVTTTLDQVGADAQRTEVTSELPSGQTVAIAVTGGRVYLPIIVK